MIIAGTDLPIALLIGCAWLIAAGLGRILGERFAWCDQRARQDHRAFVMLSEAHRFIARHRAQVRA